MTKESELHLKLKQQAKNLLLKKGFYKDQIYFEYYFDKRKRVDCVGIKDNLKIAIECGSLSEGKDRIKKLEKFFDEVIHLPYPKGTFSNEITMKIKNKTKERLLKHGKMGQSFDELINQLLDRVERRKRK